MGKQTRKTNQLKFLSLTLDDEELLDEGQMLKKSVLIYKKNGKIKLLVPKTEDVYQSSSSSQVTNPMAASMMLHQGSPQTMVANTSHDDQKTPPKRKTNAYKRISRRLMDIFFWWLFDD